MRKFLMAAVAVAAMAGGSVAMADEFNGQQQSQAGINAYLDQQAVNAEDADPTAPHSLRSGGR